MTSVRRSTRRADDAAADGNDPAGEVVGEIAAAGGSAVANRSSVAEPEGAAAIVETALGAFGRIDIVINNAGVVLTDPFPRLTIDALMVSWATHVKGPFMISQRAWGPMTDQGYGRILNICSVDGVVFGVPDHAAYDAAKAGLAGMTKTMAAEGLPLGIHVNGLLPGAFTRGQASVDPALTPNQIDMRPRLVAPTAAWLVHERCDAAGLFFTSSSGRLGRVFTGTAAGFQASDPDSYSMELIEEHWQEATATAPYAIPTSAQEYNAFRTEIFEAHVVPTS